MEPRKDKEVTPASPQARLVASESKPEGTVVSVRGIDIGGSEIVVMAFLGKVLARFGF